MANYTNSDDFSGSLFLDTNMSGSVFREADLSGVKMHGVLLIGADIDGAIEGLRVNGVEVAPLIEAELNRRQPERALLRSRTPQELREGWAWMQGIWAATMKRAEALPPADLDRSVNDEWSFAQTLRHLIFVTDSWLSHAVLAESRPFHRLALPAGFIDDGHTYGIDNVKSAPFEEVAAARADRMAKVQSFLDEVTQEELERVREPNPAPGWPSPAARTALYCVHVVLNEEWAHHEFAVRDLAIIEAG
ncbi:hypothetical protein Rhe02_36770 [Rhizocola hellebori]|uniref:DinB-like domain-containing protein n=1 Tax=Rhizocola hellebori TaxID=1392758 RepID=A0A8J3Q850_9ACTN|nr:DinB family protein [Rhizocola hellebori]GIH05610.1 hypothetical protein Rhe02_36770 [Rhizocola hellebori]